MNAPETPTGPGPRARAVRRAALLLGGVSLAIVAAVGLALRGAGPRSSRLVLSKPADWERAPRDEFAGDGACRECHPAESAWFARSGHARTLRPAAEIPLARALDGRTVEDPERKGVAWSYAVRGGRLEAARSVDDGTVTRHVLEYAFGSDHHATTFVTLDGGAKPVATEHRLTHFARGDALGITPGQSQEKPFPGMAAHGRTLPGWEARKCFWCHATWMADSGPDTTDVAGMIPNVSCERCHGPGSAHVAAARAGMGGDVLALPFGEGRATAAEQMALCGGCHRHPDQALPGRIRPEVVELARFQPVGLMQSACYKRSDGAFSCVTCHDPHARASPDLASYEAACLKCHDARPKPACPVSPRSGCVGCHMPRVDTGQVVGFTDHWIRVRKADDLPAGPAHP